MNIPKFARDVDQESRSRMDVLIWSDYVDIVSVTAVAPLEVFVAVVCPVVSYLAPKEGQLMWMV